MKWFVLWRKRDLIPRRLMMRTLKILAIIMMAVCCFACKRTPTSMKRFVVPQILDTTGCELGSVRACRTNQPGICSFGVSECVIEGTSTNWSDRCIQIKEPTKEEVCGDGLDNNCNGIVDEGCKECVPGATEGCQTGFAGPCSKGHRSCVGYT
jgi:hypothetical protein